MSNEKPRCDCGCMGAGPAITGILGHFGPSAARDHFKAARIEFLKGVRAVIDSRIDHLSRKQPAAAGSSVPVE